MTRILVIAPSWVGDALLAQTLLALLRQRDPDASIDVLAPVWALPIFRRMPQVSDAIESPFSHGELALRGRIRLGKSLRARRYDRAYVLPNSFKSALVPLIARVPQRIGFVGEARQLVLTDARPLNRRALPRMVDRFASLALARGAPLPRPLPAPRLEVELAERQRLFSELGLDCAAPLVCLCPGAEYGPAKRWPTQYFGALAAALAAQGQRVCAVGSARERELGEAIRASSNHTAVNLCGRTTLDQAVVVLSGAAMVVTNDSGLMHVAAALDRPLVALFGSSSPEFTPPLSARARIVRLDLPCSPCFERTCPLGHFDCMMKLMPERVLAEIQRHYAS